MKKKIIAGTIGLLAITGVVLGFTLFNKDKINGSTYTTALVTRGNVEALVITTGTLNPVLLVDVGSQVSGKIEEIHVDFNSPVSKGQVLAKIDQSYFITSLKQEEANYLSTKAGLDKSKMTLESLENKKGRYAELFGKDLVSFEEMENIETQYFNAKADVQSAEARLAQAQSQLDSSRVDLDYTVIKSPVDGVVIDRRVNVGQTVAASMQAPILFIIAQNLSSMQVECSIDEADIGLIEEEQKVKFTVDAYPDKEFTGKVSQIRYSPDITQNVVTYKTIVAVENPELKLLPGMTATVSIVVGEAADALLVPNAALRYSPQFSEKEMGERMDERRANGESPGNLNSARAAGTGMNLSRQETSRVWIVDDTGSLKSIPVKTGVTDNSYTEIFGVELVDGQPVITGENSTEVKQKSSPTSDSMGQMMRMIR
jgi:HlyD family secretion protein